MLDDKNPFGYPLVTYAWVIGISVLAGVVKYINTPGTFSLKLALRDVLTASFTGLVAFWGTEHFGVTGAAQAVCVAVTAVMGNRAWSLFEDVLRARLGGLPTVPQPPAVDPQPKVLDNTQEGQP